MFAYDTVLVCAGTNLNYLILRVNNVWNIIADWDKFYKLWFIFIKMQVHASQQSRHTKEKDI